MPAFSCAPANVTTVSKKPLGVGTSTKMLLVFFAFWVSEAWAVLVLLIQKPMFQLILQASIDGVAALQQESYRIQSGIALNSSSLKDMVCWKQQALQNF